MKIYEKRVRTVKIHVGSKARYYFGPFRCGPLAQITEYNFWTVLGRRDTFVRNGVQAKISAVRCTGGAYGKIEAIFMYGPCDLLGSIDGPLDTHKTGTVLNSGVL